MVNPYIWLVIAVIAMLGAGMLFALWRNAR